MIKTRTIDRNERDRLVLFLSKLILNRENVVDVIRSNGMKILIDLVTLAHLHTSRNTYIYIFFTVVLLLQLGISKAGCKRPFEPDR